MYLPTDLGTVSSEICIIIASPHHIRSCLDFLKCHSSNYLAQLELFFASILLASLPIECNVFERVGEVGGE